MIWPMNKKKQAAPTPLPPRTLVVERPTYLSFPSSSNPHFDLTKPIVFSTINKPQPTHDDIVFCFNERHTHPPILTINHFCLSCACDYESIKDRKLEIIANKFFLLNIPIWVLSTVHSKLLFFVGDIDPYQWDKENTLEADLHGTSLIQGTFQLALGVRLP